MVCVRESSDCPHTPLPGRICLYDSKEAERSSASQEVLNQLYSARVEQQHAAEARENLRKLQPPVSSLTGIFREAELNNVASVDAMVKKHEP